MYNEILEHALEKPGEECCGFIACPPGSRKGELLRMQNIAENKEHSFRIDPREYVRLKEEGYDLLAVYHSHTGMNDETLTDVDMGLANRAKLPIFVISLMNERLNYYKPHNAVRPYVGRFFVEEIQDCKMLVQDYWLKEKGVRLTAFETTRNRIHSGMDDLQEYCELNQLERVPYPDTGHIVMISNLASGVPNHCGVLVEPDKVLHQPVKGESVIVDLTMVPGEIVCYLKLRI